MVRRRSARFSSVALAVAFAAILSAGPVLALTWSPVKVVTPANDSFLPPGALSSSDETAHLVYQADTRIRYRRSTDLGGTWESVKTLATNTTTVTYTAYGIASAGLTVAVLYRSDNVATSAHYLRVRVSLDGGTTWQASKIISSYTSDRRMGWGAIAVTSDAIHVAWTDRRNGTIYTSRSIDDGLTFQPRITVGTTTYAVTPSLLDGWVQVAADGSMVYFAWIPALGTSGPSGGDIAFRRSNDGGQTLKAKLLLETRDAREFPALSAAGNGLLMTYGLIDGRQIIARSIDGGVSFTKIAIARPTDTLSYTPGDVVLRGDDTATIIYTRTSAADDRIQIRTSVDRGANWTAAATAVGASPVGKDAPVLTRSAARTLVVFGTYLADGNPTGVWSRSGAN